MGQNFHTKTEILHQTEAWAEALDVVSMASPQLKPLLKKDFQQILFTGCGSTYYLSLSAAAVFQELTGRLARAVPGGELLLNPANILTGAQGKTLLIAISRSGSTTETVKAVEQFKQQGYGPVIAITNYGDEPLAGLADIPLVVEKGQEESIAQTRSFASMYVAATALTGLISSNPEFLKKMYELPDAGQSLLDTYESVGREFGEDLSVDRYYFLGSGSRYGLACEANLKMKEMTLTHSEPFHFLEFRHGPMSMASETAVVVGLLSEKNYIHENAVLNEMQARGSKILSLAESRARIEFESHIPESVRGVLYLPILQLMAFYRSLAKGLNPDRPNNLTAVVKLNL